MQLMSGAFDAALRVCSPERALVVRRLAAIGGYVEPAVKSFQVVDFDDPDAAEIAADVEAGDETQDSRATGRLSPH